MVNIKDLKSRPIDEPDRPWIYWSQALGLQAASLAITFGAIAIPFDSPYRPVRMGLRLVSIAGAIASVAKLREIEYLSKYWAYREVLREDDFLETQAMQVQGYSVTQSQPQPRPQLMPFGDPENPPHGLPALDPLVLKKQNTGLLVCGSSGSAKTTMIRYCLQTWVKEGYQVIVLDPHADPEHPEYPWHGFPYVVGDRLEIFEQIRILLDLLENKDRSKVICICDEWTDLLGFAQLEGQKTFQLLRNFLIRWGTGGRKFRKFIIGIGHTDNVEMWGLKGIGGLIRNFGILRLGDIALRYAENNGDPVLFQAIKNTAYPLLVNDILMLHPTHGHYQIKENEQPPIGLQPLNFHPLTFEFVGASLAPSMHHAPDLHQTRTTLEALYNQPCTNAPQDELIGVHCPKCDSENIRTMGKRNDKTRYRCKDCGKAWSN